MNFSIPDDLLDLRDAVREFVYHEIIPSEPRIEEENAVPDELLEKMKEMGLFGLTIPEEYGGLGIGPIGYSLITEEFGKAHSAIRALIGINNGIGSRALVLSGSNEQREEYLPKLASGDLIAAFAVSEPGAGSDVSGIQTNARVDGDSYLLNGSKHFITNGPIADIFTVLAVTDKTLGSRGGMSTFLVKKGTPGFSVGRIQDTMGSRACLRSELFFEDCSIPVQNRIGEEGKGFGTIMSCLAEGRITYAAFCVGTAQRLLEMSTEYAKQRVQFGRPIGDFQAIQHMLAEMATSIHTARTATWYAAWKCQQGEECVQEASMAKLYASEAAGRVADSAVQIHGAMGYACDLAVERLYRDARLYRIAEGTSEIQKNLIARNLLA
ncbi:MAG TPA: acyl-CoA dehydrogenase family protein [Arenicellales bacterium]|jgi:acyl-CoA dehydrogenase|nr:acyl-CoA dehydrogenase family protein [Pseudomonadales bacterium]MDP7313441.1 acyl-CoA dehydrogenase family protein [Pseudomonadales bacterium]HJL52554.1 acyl-CoA dehydrogenase family protein [Arenicellales bacterium]|tara:strand:+ start:10592 stop:11734 length:1143 start_codon:yes stop_codon:yes gene_type:complete